MPDAGKTKYFNRVDEILIARICLKKHPAYYWLLPKVFCLTTYMYIACRYKSSLYVGVL